MRGLWTTAAEALPPAHPALVDLEEQLAEQGGVITHDQARKAGVPVGRLAADWVRVGPGAYVPRAAYDLLDEARRTAATVRAALLVRRTDLVAVGTTAALVHGLPVFGGSPHMPLLVERKPDRPRHHGRSRTVAPQDVEVVHGVPVTSLARTAVDVARGGGLVRGVVTADAVLARGVSRSDLDAATAASSRWPGIAAARVAVEFADGRAESALESVGRVRFHQHGLVAPDLQVVLGDDEGVIGRVDHYWAATRTIGEADGALKYAEPADLFAEKVREDRFRDAGYQVVRYTWDESVHRPQVVVARFLRAFARSHRRAA